MAMHIHKLANPRRPPSVSTVVLICITTLVIHLVLWNNPRRIAQVAREVPAEPDADVPVRPERRPVGQFDGDGAHELRKDDQVGDSTRDRELDDEDVTEREDGGGKEDVDEGAADDNREVVEEDGTERDGGEEKEERFERKIDPKADLVAEKGVTPASERSCESEKYAFDSENKTCYENLSIKLRSQLIYASDNPAARYLYCAIPKNGCTYHLGLMFRIAGAEKYGQGGQVHDSEKKDAHTLAKKEVSEVERMFGDEGFAKYLVIRNPIARTLSAYLDKVERHLAEEKRVVENFHKWIYKEFPYRAELGMNPHWRPQVTFCGFKLRDMYRYFKVFRVEEPEEYVSFLEGVVADEFLMDGWGSGKNQSFRESVLGPRKRTRHTDERILYYFNNVTVFDYLREALKEDVERLGYTEEVEGMRRDIVERVRLDGKEDPL